MDHDQKDTGNRLSNIVEACYTEEALMEWLNLSPHDLEQPRKNHTLLAVRTSDGYWLYPTWQFNSQTGEILPGLSDVLQVLATGINDEWSHALWLQGKVERELDGKSAREWLLNGGDIEQALRLARADAAVWSAP